MSGAKENHWEFDPAEFENGTEEHAVIVFNKATSLDWWNESISLIDFGCGTGTLARVFAKHKKVSHIDALDVEERMIAYAKKRAKEEDLCAISFNHLKKLDGSEIMKTPLVWLSATSLL